MEIRDEARGMLPPNSMEAEISVLGAMLQDSIAVQRATEQLKPEDFYQPEHRELFQTMADLNRRQAPIDLTTLQAELSRKGTLEGVGGLRHPALPQPERQKKSVGGCRHLTHFFLSSGEKKVPAATYFPP